MENRRRDSPPPIDQEDLFIKLRRVGVLQAEDDDRSKDVEYFIMPGREFDSASTSTYESEDAVAVAPTGSDGPIKKGKDACHLVIFEKLGCGGFGVAYRAEMTKGKGSRNICLKRAKCGPNSWDTLTNENDIFNHLHEHPHDNIINRLFLCHTRREDIFQEDIFLGLEYFDGLSLSNLIRNFKNDNRFIEHHHLVMILSQQAEAIQHLQNNGICHCDIKPDNILYSTESRISKLIDFGLAVLRYGVSKTLKSQGGTTEYMAPETLVDRNLQFGTDLFGLGAALTHLVTLETPWNSVEAVRALRKQKKLGRNEKRKEIKRAIKKEIERYREIYNKESQTNSETNSGSNSGSDGQNDSQIKGELPIQRELRTCQHPELEIKELIYKMLHHDLETRVDVEDILKHLKTVQVGTSVSRQSSSASLTSSTSQSNSLPGMSMLHKSSSQANQTSEGDSQFGHLTYPNSEPVEPNGSDERDGEWQNSGVFPVMDTTRASTPNSLVQPPRVPTYHPMGPPNQPLPASSSSVLPSQSISPPDGAIQPTSSPNNTTQSPDATKSRSLASPQDEGEDDEEFYN